MLQLSYRAALPSDLPVILELLNTLNLPVAGVEQSLPGFVVARDEIGIVGVAGAERYGGAILLRSVAVHPSARRVGVAEALVTRVLTASAEMGAAEAYLLTTSAQSYFSRLGFAVIDRAQVPDEVKESIEFREACPASATVMRRRLSPSRGG